MIEKYWGENKKIQKPIDQSYEFGEGGGKKQPTMWSQLGSNVGKGLKSIGDYGKAVVGTAGYRLGQRSTDKAIAGSRAMWEEKKKMYFQ